MSASVPNPSSNAAFEALRVAWLNGGEMRDYHKDHTGALGPDEVRTLVAAFDKAWGSVQASGTIFDTAVKAESARAVLAKHIIEAAKQGERDQRRLRDGALVSLAQSTLRSAPRHVR